MLRRSCGGFLGAFFQLNLDSLNWLSRYVSVQICVCVHISVCICIWLWQAVWRNVAWTMTGVNWAILVFSPWVVWLWIGQLPSLGLAVVNSEGIGIGHVFTQNLGSPGASQVALVVKNLPASVGDPWDADSIPGSGRSPEEGNGNPPQYSRLENPMDRGAWRATVHGVPKSWTHLSD